MRAEENVLFVFERWKDATLVQEVEEVEEKAKRSGQRYSIVMKCKCNRKLAIVIREWMVNNGQAVAIQSGTAVQGRDITEGLGSVQPGQ